jgi:hypothetical protein
MHILLVIDSNPANNWYRVFKGLKGVFAQCPPPPLRSHFHWSYQDRLYTKLFTLLIYSSIYY